MARDDIFDREPEISPGILGGVFSPREGCVRGESLVASLVHAASQMGATCLEGVEVSGLQTEGRRVTGVRTADDVYYSDHTILAAGPWTGVAGRWVPEDLPVRPVKGQRILLRKAGFLPRCPVNIFGGYVIPQVDGNLLVAATHHEGEFDEEITADAVSGMIDTAVSIFPALLNAKFVGARAGVRPASPDEVPIIGPVPGWDGLSVASGHYTVGIILSPGTGELMADYISTGDATPLEPFSLSRFRPAT
jgi:glycine oxidase